MLSASSPLNSERYKIEVLGEFTNLFNHTNVSLAYNSAARGCALNRRPRQELSGRPQQREILAISSWASSSSFDATSIRPG
jgi:hypothetical protein